MSDIELNLGVGEVHGLDGVLIFVDEHEEDEGSGGKQEIQIIFFFIFSNFYISAHIFRIGAAPKQYIVHPTDKQFVKFLDLMYCLTANSNFEMWGGE